MSRSFFLVSGIAEALHVIAYIGAITATLAAILAVVQNDIKKILAYSTISQLGYMVMALGLGSSDVAMYHLTTHAFFKALLFLGAGAMIHALHTQDIWEMGGLFKSMPVTAGTFLIGTLALCGIFPLSGFFSKDEILTLAFEHNKVIFGMALFCAGLTAFYMTRAIWIAVLGPKRAVKKHGAHHGENHAEHHDSHALPAGRQEAPLVMRIPLIVLSVLSIVGGFIGIPAFLGSLHEHGHGHIEFNMTIAIISTVVALTGIGIGTLVYARLRGKEDPLVRVLGAAYHFIVRKYYLDDLAFAIADVFQKTMAKLFFWFDANVVIQKGVNGAAALTAGLGSFLRRSQTGQVQTYAMVFGFGLAALLLLALIKV